MRFHTCAQNVGTHVNNKTVNGVAGRDRTAKGATAPPLRLSNSGGRSARNGMDVVNLSPVARAMAELRARWLVGVNGSPETGLPSSGQP